jgi:hypothetical protein
MSTLFSYTLNWASAYCGYLGLTVGTGSQPSLGSVHYIVDTILSAPFVWAWNRKSTTQAVSAGIQDYTFSLTDFGFIETVTAQPCATITQVAGSGTLATITAPNSFVVGNKVTITGLTNTGFNVVNAAITAATTTSFTFASGVSLVATGDTGLAVSGQVFQFQDVFNTDCLSESNDLARPTKICVLTDNLTGTQKMRLMPSPDQNYNIIIQYQKSSPAITDLTGNWPFPDDFTDVFNALFLGMSYEYVQDPRGTQWLTRGTAALLRKSEGLSEMDKQSVMAAFIPGMLIPQSASQKEQQAIAARAQG